MIVKAGDVIPLEQQYVAGFLTDPECQRVALILKNKPDYLKGKLNGIGGKIERLVGGSLEDGEDAMQREFLEETGLTIPYFMWNKFLTLYKPGHYFVDFFHAKSVGVDEVRTIEKEQVQVVPIHLINKLPVVPNLRWIIPMMLDTDLKFPIYVEEKV